MYLLEELKNPHNKYKVYLMHHKWAEIDLPLWEDLFNKCNLGGMVTNRVHGIYETEENGKNIFEIPETLEDLKAKLDYFKDKDFGYWIYDECGYPSGFADGLTTKKHPELNAKGIFMVRYTAYDEPKKINYKIPFNADCIVAANLYETDCQTAKMETKVNYASYKPVHFTKKSVKLTLKPGETVYIFVKATAYEGTHSTHNNGHHKMLPNLLDKRATKRFINIALNPIYEKYPAIIKNSEAIFTDEPSITVAYHRENEEWPFAFAPYYDEMFGDYKEMYGESILPTLPLIFENGNGYAQARTKFYEFTSKMFVKNYVDVLRGWCEGHGTKLSGHYLGEETLHEHVYLYGNLINVVKEANTPGIDVITCDISSYDPFTAKFAEAAIRKSKSNGMMAEICPFVNIKKYREDPLTNTVGVTGELYLSGVRHINSYVRPMLSEDELSKFAEPEKYTHLTPEEFNKFSTYTARLGMLLERKQSETGIFVYYPIEDAQSAYKPSHSYVNNSDLLSVTNNLHEVTDNIYENGHNYLIADSADLKKAIRSLKKNGTAEIGGNKIKALFIPEMTYIHKDTVKAVKELNSAGIIAGFMKAPKYYVETGEEITEDLPIISAEKMLKTAAAVDKLPFTFGKNIHIAKFTEDKKPLYALLNFSRKNAKVTFTGSTATMLLPFNLKEKRIIGDTEVTVPKGEIAFFYID